MVRIIFLTIRVLIGIIIGKVCLWVSEYAISTKTSSGVAPNTIYQFLSSLWGYIIINLLFLAVVIIFDILSGKYKKDNGYIDMICVFSGQLFLSLYVFVELFS